MTIRYRTGHRIDTRNEDDDGDGPLRFVIATEGRKADGIDLQMDRLDLTRYQANPVILPSHSYMSLPIGRGENIEVDDGRLLGDAVFDLDDELGAKVDRKYRSRFLNAVSIGFDFDQIDEETGVPDRWEMVEFSSVSVPLDADALVDSGRMARAWALTEEVLRAGKVLSASNKNLVEDAIDALQTLLAAAEKADDEADDEDRAAAAVTREMRRRRLTIAST